MSLKLAIVGCGAVVELCHLPAAQRVPQVEVVALADPDLERARALARQFRVPQAVPDYRLLLDTADAFLLATPPHLHRPIGSDMLSRGKPVLCEKPLAPNSQEAAALAAAAREHKALLALGHNRRFSWNLEALRALLAGGGMGQVTAIEVEDGFPLSWPSRTDFVFQPAQVGGGVLMENGVHVLDTLLWLFGPAQVEEYQDDSLGGMESNARLRLRFTGDIPARVWITRTAEARNRLRLEAADGWAEAPIYDTTHLTFDARRGKAGRALGPVTIAAEQPQDYVDLMAAQLADFAHAIRNQHPPRTTGEDGVQTIRLVEQAYALKRGRPLPEQAPLPGETW